MFDTKIIAAIQRYFDLMYDCDTSRFNKVFCDSANLHGLREGEMTVWSAREYEKILAERQSPQSLDAPRDETILFIDVASESQAAAKVRVRINKTYFIDYLIFHRINGEWKITSKAYHTEHV